LGESTIDMSFLSHIFKKKAELVLHDSVFGDIKYNNGTWCHIPELLVGGYMISIDAPESGPDNLQKRLFQKIVKDLPDYEKKAKDYINETEVEELDVNLLSIYSIEIGNVIEVQRELFVLELSDSDAHTIHRVTFQGSGILEYECED
jgi:hypothetical protein